jgi:hypothetical protein
MENQETKSTVISQLQEKIFDGAKVIITKSKDLKVELRLNKDMLSEKDAWRVIIDGSMYFCSRVVLHTKAYTESVITENNEKKFNVVTQSNFVEFKNNEANVY